MRIIALAAILAAGPLAAQQRPDRVRGDTAEELKQIEREIGAANIRRDKAYFDRIEADEFLFTGSNGGITTKAEDLAGLDEPASSTLDSYVVDDMTVKVYGATAVVWGRSTVAGHSGSGTPFRIQSRFTDTFVVRDGRWQLVAGHSSRIPAPRP
jgi:uncharacterized protein DUF4440